MKWYLIIWWGEGWHWFLKGGAGPDLLHLYPIHWPPNFSTRISAGFTQDLLRFSLTFSYYTLETLQNRYILKYMQHLFRGKIFTRFPIVVCALKSFVFLRIDIKNSLKCLTNLSSQSFAEISAIIATHCSFFAPPTIVAFEMQEKNEVVRQTFENCAVGTFLAWHYFGSFYT